MHGAHLRIGEEPRVTREQRTVFGEVAELYERTRPGYPDGLFDAVLEFGDLHAGDRALEVGAGTGKATRGFIARGLDVLALEPAPGMADVLRHSYPSVIETTFEDWTVDRGAFGLLYAAQAWHWVEDHPAAYARVADALRDGGTIALFWNLARRVRRRARRRHPGGVSRPRARRSSR